MEQNNAFSPERVRISFFGRRNAGKSSLVNAITSQDMSLVSEVMGTTTDPVSKTMELLPIGPVFITDTPGIDDEGGIGQMRVKRALRELERTDIAVIVVDFAAGVGRYERELISKLEEMKTPYIVAFNKCDIWGQYPAETEKSVYVSALKGVNINRLKEKIGEVVKAGKEREFLPDIVEKGDKIVLVVPIDQSAPKGRLILPQQRTIRELLDREATAVVTVPDGLKDVLSEGGKRPKMVITDSQVFGYVNKITPKDVYLTSFSILFARYKGDLPLLAKGAFALDGLEENSRVLISEGCTHHRQCKDIGSVKIPGWIREHTGKNMSFDFSSGPDFPEDLSPFSAVIHCGGCMLNEKEMSYRIRRAVAEGVPITNYGTAIAHMNGMLERSLEPFGGFEGILE